MTTPTHQAAAAVLDEVVAKHAEAEEAWSLDTDPATARRPPKPPTHGDFIAALVDAGIIATNVEWGVLSSDGHVNDRYAGDEQMTRIWAADDGEWRTSAPRVVVKRLGPTAWKPADA